MQAATQNTSVALSNPIRHSGLWNGAESRHVYRHLVPVASDFVVPGVLASREGYFQPHLHDRHLRAAALIGNARVGSASPRSLSSWLGFAPEHPQFLGVLYCWRRRCTDCAMRRGRIDGRSLRASSSRPSAPSVGPCGLALGRAAPPFSRHRRDRGAAGLVARRTRPTRAQAIVGGLAVGLRGASLKSWCVLSASCFFSETCQCSGRRLIELVRSPFIASAEGGWGGHAAKRFANMRGIPSSMGPHLRSCIDVALQGFSLLCDSRGLARLVCEMLLSAGLFTVWCAPTEL